LHENNSRHIYALENEERPEDGVVLIGKLVAEVRWEKCCAIRENARSGEDNVQREHNVKYAS